jgi:dihydrofolate synthase/folylpolyglutamate synthase
LVDPFEWLEGHLDHESGTVGIAAGAIEGLSLEPMRRLMHVLGDPQEAMPVIHVTGTNGKGSTTAMLRSLLMANGLSVGTYTSPHLDDVCERIARDGVPIAREELGEVLAGIAAAEPMLDDTPTWFEVLTAAALRWFAEAPVDVAVLEVGLLGRYDATNVVTADVAVITGVGGDHTDFAPGWQLKVAEEKAGIITPGRPAVVGPVTPEVLAVIEAEGAEPVLASGRDFEVVDARLAVGGRMLDIAGPQGEHHEVLLGLHGAHQADNAAVALTAAEDFFGRELDDEVVTEAFAEVTLPARLEVVAHQPLVVLDTAHNPDALAAMAATVDDDFAVVGSRVVVIGMLAGRDPQAAAEAISAARPDLVICTTVAEGARGLPAADLAGACEALGLAADVVADPGAAVARALAGAAEEDLVIICGSFRLPALVRSAVSQP